MYSTGIFFADLQEEFQKKGLTHLRFKAIEATDSDQDPRIIEIYYPNLIKPTTEYIQPKILLEIGCRSLREPFIKQAFGSLVDEVYSGRDFVEPLFQVPTVIPERTFLVKLFLLHEEFQRSAEKMRVDRLSRHLYDLFHLTKAGIAEKAIQNKSLYETIVSHRYTFARVGNVDYNLHHPNSINPIPPDTVISLWKDDYAQMQQDMIYEKNPPTFAELIQNLEFLKTILSKVSWKFELTFPFKPNTRQDI